MGRRLANDALVTSSRRAGARAHSRAMGLDEHDWSRPLVGIATTWTGTMPCNLGQRARPTRGGRRQRGGRDAARVQHDRDLGQPDVDGGWTAQGKFSDTYVDAAERRAGGDR